MSMRSLLASVVVACVAASASADLEITEICARCQSKVPAQKDLGWVELYNNGTEAVNLANYKLLRTNRGKAPAPANISALCDRTVEPGAYTVVYTSEMFANGAAATEVASYTYGNYGEIMVLPQKVNQKKYPMVQLYKAADDTLLQTVVVPVDLADNKSYTTQNGTRQILATPTPGAANNTTDAVAYGPNISSLYGVKKALDPWQAFPLAKVGEAYSVSFPVNPIDLSTSPDDAIQSVTLLYRVDTGTTIIAADEVPMSKTTSADKLLGDVYTATIPASAITTPGARVLFAAKITDGANRTFRSPSFKNPDDGYEWYGTIVEPTADQLSSTLQTLHLFVDANSKVQMDKDTDDQNLTVVPYNARCGIYDSSTGFYYDNVRIDLRGNTSASFAKKSHGLRFNKSQPLTCTDPVTGTKVTEIRKSSFTSEYADPSFLRQHLAFKLFNDYGSSAPFHYPVRLNRNGEFYQLAFHSERFTDELIEDCYGYDPLGYSYKNVGNFNGTTTNAGSIEKKTPDDDNEKDLAQLTTFIAKIADAAQIGVDTDFAASPTYSAALTKVVVENFDLPAWINYLALARITHENDDVWANLSAYYDINGLGTWKPLAYDMNLSFGQYYNDVSSMSGSGITADNDAFKSHPFYGGFHVRVEALKTDKSRCCRAVEAVWQSEKFRRLYLRRLRTLMDEILKEPGTAKEATPFWQYASSITNAIVADAALDRATTPIYNTCNKIWNWGSSTYKMTVADGMEDIWNNYVEKRRIHLYNTHSVTNTAKAVGYGSAFNAGIPLAQSSIATLAAGFSIENANEDGQFTATDKIVIKNANNEAVDMSGWKMTGAVTYTFPAGSVIDANGTITVVADRKAYVAANAATLTDEVLLGNAVFAVSGTVNLLAADETTVIQGELVEVTEPAEPEGPVAGDPKDPNVVWNSDGGMFVYENFGRAVKLTVNYETTEPLTNFPVLVKLAANSPEGFTYADFYNDTGADLVFVDDAGKVIPHEIDTWNRSGTSLVWVKVPVVTNQATFAMCYRSAKDGSKLVTDGVWNDYTGVWHLGETGDGVQTVLDSTTNDLDTVSHANSLAEVSGPVGAARRISTKGGASDANGRVFLDLSQNAEKKAKVDDLGTSFTASFWAKLSGNSDWAYLIGRKANDNDLSWAMQFNSATDQKSIRIFTSANNQSQKITVNEFANLKTAWIKVDLVYNNNNFIIYCNGALASQGNTLNNTTAKQQGDFAFGGCAGSGYGSFNGWMDEVRLRKGVPSAAWVAADHATQATDTFLAAATVVEIAEKPIPVVDLQLVDSGARYVQFSAKAGNFGGAATSCAVEYKLWADGDAEPATYTKLIDSLVLNKTAAKFVTGLSPESKYCYKLRANNSLSGGTSEDVCGEFTTGGTGEPGDGGDRYRVYNDYVHKYIIGTEDMTFTPPSYVTKFTALIVGGGGAGGYRHGGGGGAGGLVYTEVDVTPGETFTVSVGAGGVASSDINVLGSNGGDSTLSKNGEVIRRAVGGGAGGNCYVNPSDKTGVDWNLTRGRDGGSGGGNGYFNYDSNLGSTYAVAYNKHRGQGTADQGFNGGAANVGQTSITGANCNYGSVSGGGGGGAGKVGGDASEDDPPGAGAGGAGKQYDISGKTVYYAGGGAGGTLNVNNKNTLSIGGAGGGGNGGWYTTMATPGVDGLGGGGGGGSDEAGYYQGANGGSGCVYIRYSVQGDGAGSAKPVGSLTAAALADGLMKVKIDYRAAWAGEGYEVCDVYAAYGTTPNALTGEALIAQGTIGTGSGEFSLNAPDTVFYVRLRLKNASGEVNDSDDIYTITTGSLNETPSTVLTLASSSVAGGNLSATINSTAAGTVWRLMGVDYFGDTLEGWTKESLGPIAANGSLEDTVAIDDVNFVRYALGKSDGSYEFTETIVLAKLDVPALGEPTATANAISATVTGEATSFGLSERGTLRLYVSKVNDIATCKLNQEIHNQSTGNYSIELTNLEPRTTYYYYVEVLSENGGAAKSELKSFSTLGVSLASRQASVDQRNVTFSAKFGQIPSDIDSVTFKLKISLDGSAGEEVEVANSVTADTPYTHMVTAAAFGAKFEAEYIAVCTAGDKVWRQSLDKIAATTVDTATYTWGANPQGELSGNWNDPAHWQCNKEQRSDLPGVNNTVRFAPDVTEAYTVTLTADTIVGNIDFTGNTARNISIAGNGKQLSYTSLASLNSPSSSGLKLTFDNVVLTGINVAQATSFVQNWPDLTTGNVAAELRFVNNSRAQFTGFFFCGNSSRVEVASGSTLTANKFALAGNGTVATIDNATIIAKQHIVLPDNVDNSSLTIELKGANPLLKAEGTGFQWFGGYNTNSDLPVVFRCFVPVGGWKSAPVQDYSTTTNVNYGAYLFAKPYNNGAVQAKFRFEVAPESPIVGSGVELTAIPIVTTANGIYTNNVEELTAINDAKHALSGGFAYSEAMNKGGDYPLNLVLNLSAGQIDASVPETDDGTVDVTGEGENAVAVITPNEGATSVTVTVPASYTGKIQVPASVDTVSGVTLAQLVVVANAPYGETTVDISAAFKKILAENGSITIALDPEASVQVGDETIAVRPSIVEADDASIADGSVATKTIPGLYYQLVRWNSLAADKTETTVVEPTRATGTTLKLTDPDKPADTAFYIIRVEK